MVLQDQQFSRILPRDPLITDDICMMAIPTTRQVFRRTPGNNSDPQTLTLYTEPIPNPLPPQSLLIRVHAISINYRDANILHNTNPWAVLNNGIPCSDCAGEIIAIGEKVTKWKVGDRVSPIFDQRSISGEEQEREWLGGEVDGVLADYVIFREQGVVRVPEGLTWGEGAVLVCAGVTAWSGLGFRWVEGEGDGGLVGGRKTILVMG